MTTENKISDPASGLDLFYQFESIKKYFFEQISIKDFTKAK
jgi:hypothetical protein